MEDVGEMEERKSVFSGNRVSVLVGEDGRGGCMGGRVEEGVCLQSDG